jgi:hypothetical protein
VVAPVLVRRCVAGPSAGGTGWRSAHAGAKEGPVGSPCQNRIEPVADQSGLTGGCMYLAPVLVPCHSSGRGVW